MKLDILSSLDDLLKTLEKCKTEEKDGKTIELYDFHINRTIETIEKLRKDGLDKILIDNFFEQEGRSYGWSYLPNDNGKLAEEAFWNLKKKLGYY
jgi:hypothetical protein